MPEAAILEEIRNDLNFLKEKVTLIEVSLNEIDADLHKELNPDAKKLEKIEKEDKRIHFKNMEEFDKHFGV
ncbi:Uncharacterised protein [uncultured archaeon]|nr:Uncharacterised protein [uncultured archaeon]